MIIIATGPAQGTMSIAGRYCIVSKSPHSGIFIDSHVGGYLGPEIKFAGYDMIIITGKADSPKYVVIEDETVEIRSGDHLWGKNIIETTHTISDEFRDDCRVVAIGPAGENQVYFAATNSDYYRTAARGGVGMIFGSKNLKALAVKGSGSVTVHDSELTRKVRSDINRRAKTSSKNGHHLPKLGTSWLVPIASANDQLPTKNYQAGEWDNAELIAGKQLHLKYGEDIIRKPCYRCTLACSYVIDVDYEWSNGNKIQHPEYESLALLGSNLGISELQTLLHLNHRCNILGLDTISTGSTISWFMECSEKNIVPKEFDNERIEFGDGEGALDLIRKIAYKEGVGKILAGGVRRAAEYFEHPTQEWAVHVRGLELPAWDPRGKLGLGLSYITSNVGGSHLRGLPRTSEIPDSSALPVIDSMIEEQDLKILKDSLIMCHFTHSIDPKFTIEDVANMYEALTGVSSDYQSMRAIAHRIWLLTRWINTQIWQDVAPRETDILPPRLMKDGLPSGIAKGSTSFESDQDLHESLDYFYTQRQCGKDGRPTADALNQLQTDLQLSD